MAITTQKNQPKKIKKVGGNAVSNVFIADARANLLPQTDIPLPSRFRTRLGNSIPFMRAKVVTTRQ